MSRGRSSVRAKRRLLTGAAAVVLLSLAHGAPAARQGCGQAPVTRLGGATATSSDSLHPAVSSTGRYVAFQSSAPDLDGDVTRDIFVYDRQTCALELVSVNSSGVKGNSDSTAPSISDDGRFVTFVSTASNLVAPDTNGFVRDGFLRDRQLGITVLISVDSSEVQPATESASELRISGDGAMVAFISRATSLVPGDTNGEDDVFVRDVAAGTTERVSVSTAGEQGDSPAINGVGSAVLSEDGRFVAFFSWMTNLVPGDLNGAPDIFVRDREQNTTVRASLNSSGGEVAILNLSGPSMTADGRFVVFASNINLVAGDPSCDGIFVRDLVANETSCLGLDPADLTASQNGRWPAVSSDGRWVAFTSLATHYVPGDTNGVIDAFVHDRTTGATQRVNVSASGTQANGSVNAILDISDDGVIVAFESLAGNLVPFDPTLTDVFVAVWDALPSVRDVDLMRNGTFAAGLQLWQAFATPDLSYVVTDTTAGELQFYRQAPPPGTSNQAVVFQQTSARLFAHSPIEARFRLGNSSTARKRISVLVHEADFSDLAVCTFWLAPGAPMRDYVMRTHTTKYWTNATIGFYAATAGSDGGFYRVDTVSLLHLPSLDDDVTDCIDPTSPVAPGGASSPTLLTNGDFAAGLAPWTTFGQITWQITNGVFEFVRPPGTPAGVLLQPTGQALAPNDILTGFVYLGNSSPVRKRVTMILHDQDFSDLSACTFWLPPQLPLSPYFMRTFATQAWANATLSVYPATIGPDEWIRFTDATLQMTPGTTPLGTECIEPGADPLLAAARGLAPDVRPSPRSRSAAASQETAPPAPSLEPILTPLARESASGVVWQGVFDLGPTRNAVWSFQSWLESTEVSGVAEISLDGANWSTAAIVPASTDWTPVEIDLSAHAGRIVSVRLAFQRIAPPRDGSRDQWQIRQIRVSPRALSRSER